MIPTSDSGLGLNARQGKWLLTGGDGHDRQQGNSGVASGGAKADDGKNDMVMLFIYHVEIKISILP